jgi:hypothetical protein
MKITKAFLDATYAFLDGLVFLVDEGSPVGNAENFPEAGAIDAGTTGRVGLLDTSDMVSYYKCLLQVQYMLTEKICVRTRARFSSSLISYT